MAAADKCQPTIIGMSALLTTTMTYMKTVIDGFEAAGRGHIKMAIGGAPISQMFADEIGADGYGPTRRPPSICSCAWRERRDGHGDLPRSSTGRKSPRRSRRRTTPDDVTLPLPERFQERIDALAARARPAAAPTTTSPSGTGATSRSATARPRTSPRPCTAELEAKADW